MALAMFSLSVRDHVMIAHSFKGSVFGPAQRLHGATYVVDVEVRRGALDADGLVVDIGLLSRAVRGILADLEYRNLDDVPAFSGKNTTTEFLARELWDRLVGRIAAGELGESAKSLESARVTLHESHVAWAAYDAVLPVS